MTADLELAALVRLGLGDRLGAGVAPRPDEAPLDALVREGRLLAGQRTAVKAYVARHAVRCGCGAPLLAPEGLEAFPCPACGRAVGRAPSAGAGAPAPSPAAAEPPGRGSRVGPLELLEVLGRGAFGTVHRARHVELGREVAVKVVPGAATNAQVRARFQRELEAQARLDHPGIVRLHALHETRGALACEMDLVEGETLSARLARAGPLPWREAAALVAGLARAVAHAHARGVVHRDLKPQNVLLRARDGQAVLVDFGLALLLDGSVSLTRSGAAVGTPVYMSPEALAGKTGPASDVYGLGAILYETLTGRMPYDERTPMALLCAVLNGRCPPTAAPGAPPALEQVRARAMAVDPAERHPSAEALAEDLEALLAGQAPRPVVRRRTRVPWKTLGIAVLLLVGVPAGVLLQVATAPPPPPAALLEEAERVAVTDAARARGLALQAVTGASDLAMRLRASALLVRLDDSAGALAVLGPPAPLGSQEGLALARGLRAAGAPDAALKVLPPGHGRLRVALLLEVGRADLALQELQADLGSAQRHDALVARGEAHLALDGLLDASRAFADARAADGDGSDALAGLAEVRLGLDAPESALELAEQALALERRPWALLVRAAARLRLGDLPAARADAREARRLDPGDRALLGPLAFARGLGSKRAEGALAEALCASARRAVLLAWDVAAERKEARARCEALAEAFPASPEATAPAQLLRRLWRDEAPAAGPVEGFPLGPGREAALAGGWALASGDDANAVRLARQALDLARTRRDRVEALLLLSRATAAGDPAGSARLVRAAERLEGPRAARRALARHDAFHRDGPTLDRVIAAEPWEPAHHALRGHARIGAADMQGAQRDDCAAGTLDPGFALRPLFPLLWADEETARAGVADVPLEGDLERAADATARAVMALAGTRRDAEQGLQALVHVVAAEAAWPTSPAALALRVLALDRLGAVRDARAAQARFERLAGPAAGATLEALRAHLAGEADVLARVARARRAQEAIDRETGLWDDEDLSGVTVLLSRLDPAGHVSRGKPPRRATRLRLAPADGWAADASGSLTATRDGAPLALEVEGDEVEAVLGVGPDAGEVDVTTDDGEVLTLFLSAPQPGRRTFPVAGGLAPGRQPLLLTARGRVLLLEVRALVYGE